jgi:GT2 family glycosyltransferase
MTEAALGFEVTANRMSCGVVVIGRNEGERLRRCLDSVQAIARFVVYVDSGSTDASVELAQAKGVDTVRLDMSTPFTAARARNAGFQRSQQVAPELRYVQFVDGDCEVFDDWLEAATSFLEQHSTVACVCGRLRERFPQRSVYNRLCDYEWDRPTGETDACGGIAMMRCAVFSSLDGFREDLVAGEEPELCRRLRHQGWKVWRLARDMAWHDAAMLHFGQWWKRSTRVGFGYAQAVWMHGGASERREWLQLLRPWIWVAAVPLTTLAAWFVWGYSAALLPLVYPLQMLRLASTSKGNWRARLVRGAFLVLGKFPEWLGQWQFWRGALRGSTTAANFDYKI